MNDTKQSAEILGRAGKSEGKYKQWLNIKFTNGNQNDQTCSINLDEVEELKFQENENECLLVDADKFMDAKLNELKSWNDKILNKT